jgi:WD40 repeat protein
MTPSGFYVASADASNKILIWDTVGEDHVTKLEKATIGKICDMAWTEDSKRLVAVGQGTAKHGEAFMIDGGASVGEIGNHVKPILSCDVKQTRPYRVVTGSEDMHVNFFEGPPFKYKQMTDKHSRFVTCVRFSPNGDHYLSVGTDKKICVYDGKTGELKKEIDNAHNGGIYGVSWASDNKRFLTASADKTCKIWDLDSGSSTHTFKFGEALEDQQLGCLWQGNTLLSINLNGDISYLTPDVERPTKVLMGHSKSIEAMVYNSQNDHFYTADREGRIIGTDRLTAANCAFSGPAHKTKVCGLAVSNNTLYSISLDDTLKATPLDSRAFPAGVSLPSQPVAVAAHGNLVFVACRDVIVTVRDTQIIQKSAAAWGPASIAVSSDGSQVAVGGNDKQLHVFSNNNGSLSQQYTNNHDGVVSSVAFSPNGKLVAAGDTDRQIKVWDKSTKISSTAWGMGARVDTLQFSPDGEYVFSSGLDSCFMIWSLTKNGKAHEQRNAHMGGVKAAQFVDNSTLLTTGQDLVTKAWKLNLK